MEETDQQNKKTAAKLEALLFIFGEPISLKKLSKIMELEEPEVKIGLEELKKELSQGHRGLALIEDGDSIQLATKPEFSKLLEDITKQEFTEALTPAALETLSIIAYAGPIPRADIEYIRGVNSSFILRTLVMRGLVEREINPKRANAYVYSASFDLLRHLGLSKISDLPDHVKYKELVANLYQELGQKDQKQAIEGLNIPADENQIKESAISQEPKQED